MYINKCVCVCVLSVNKLLINHSFIFQTLNLNIYTYIYICKMLYINAIVLCSDIFNTLLLLSLHK